MADLTRTEAQVSRLFALHEIVVDFLASEAIEAGQPVVVGTDGKCAVADGSTGGNAALTRGIAAKAGDAGASIPVLKLGGLGGFDVSGLNCGDPVYVSATAGELADAAGAVSFQIGTVQLLTDGQTKYIYVDVPWAA